MNPDPQCKQECRFTQGMSSLTSMYFPPVYDKNGNNLNPDGNVESSVINCTVCKRSWLAATQFGVTEYTERT